jgi:hypothetical protein
MNPVLAYHLIITTYGFWLPNDPRGSWSDFVRAWELFLFGGPATRTQERRSLARDPHDVARLLKGAATAQLLREGLHPFSDFPYRDGTIPTPWARKQWAVYLDDDPATERAIRYTESNPEKEGKPTQTYGFVSPFTCVAA